MPPDPGAVAPGLRCFVGQWPVPAARGPLDHLAHRLRAQHPEARRVPPANLHLTLVFIGVVPPALARRIAERMAALPTIDSPWIIDRVGGFAGARVAWAGGPAPPALLALARRMRQELDGLGVDYDRQPLVPHVTLLRAVRGPVAPVHFEPIVWLPSPPQLLVSARDPDGASRYRNLDGIPANKPLAADG